MCLGFAKDITTNLTKTVCDIMVPLANVAYNLNSERKDSKLITYTSNLVMPSANHAGDIVADPRLICPLCSYNFSTSSSTRRHLMRLKPCWLGKKLSKGHSKSQTQRRERKRRYTARYQRLAKLGLYNMANKLLDVEHYNHPDGIYLIPLKITTVQVCHILSLALSSRRHTKPARVLYVIITAHGYGRSRTQ
ncbi:hypothetical protein PIIN_06625 [Serendipita indica DSM 11827]|uniref:Uncharacterized protein n=1 Tax=Serendipita indica (strain DSM 11827) TaxID=1109443 RepID=G4TMZ5_SERID|nr:hypothetical protein PIIN_06625 [Serendipita indica DSM 11827]